MKLNNTAANPKKKISVNDNSEIRFLPESKLKKALRYIRENLEQKISLKDLAQDAGISVFYFSRMFKHSTGTPPGQLIIEKRIEYAKSLLRETDVPITEIALSCGWSNQSNFTTAFKQKVGVTPRNYRFQGNLDYSVQN